MVRKLCLQSRFGRLVLFGSGSFGQRYCLIDGWYQNDKSRYAEPGKEFANGVEEIL